MGIIRLVRRKIAKVLEDVNYEKMDEVPGTRVESSFNKLRDFIL